MPEPRSIADYFVDADGYARRSSDGLRILPSELEAGGVIYDSRGDFKPGCIIWADGSVGVSGREDVTFWEPLKNPARPVQHRGEGREWTEQELQVLQAVEWMILEALKRKDEKAADLKAAHHTMRNAAFDAVCRTQARMTPIVQIRRDATRRSWLRRLFGG